VDELIMGQSPNSEDYNYQGIGFPFLQGNAEFGSINPNPTTWCNTASKVIRVNDILVSVRAPIGAVNVADRGYGIGRGLCAIRAKKSTYKFLLYHFLARNADLNSLGTGTTYIAISLSAVKNLKIPYPPFSEQVAIATYLDHQTGKLSAIVTNLGLQIGVLKELRKTLINDVVTGKIRIKN
jgi:type I restriction enzyme, S subunit